MLIVLPVTESGSTGPLKTTDTFAFSGTLLKLLGGLTSTTFGAVV